MTEIAEQVRENGFALMQFPVDLEQRREAARLGNLVIDIALENEALKDVLTFDAAGGSPGHSTTTYAVSPPRIASDDSIWLHSGWQTAARVDAMPGSKKPEELKKFIDLQQEILMGVAHTWMDFFRGLKGGSADLEGGVNSLILDPNRVINNHHLRIVRYRNLSQHDETFSAHGDLGLVSGQLFETHQGHLRIAPYPLEMVNEDVFKKEKDGTATDILAARAKHARSLHDIAKEVRYDPNLQAVIFLGFGAAFLHDPDGTAAFVNTNAAYHFGKPPEVEQPVDDKVAEDFGEDTRVTMVAFGTPKHTTPITRYRTPNPVACRPEQMQDARLKMNNDSKK